MDRPTVPVYDNRHNGRSANTRQNNARTAIQRSDTTLLQRRPAYRVVKKTGTLTTVGRKGAVKFLPVISSNEDRRSKILSPADLDVNP